MGLSNLEFFLREAGQSLRRHPLMSLAAISIGAAAMAMVGGSLLFILNLNLWAGKAPEAVEINIFLQRELSRQEALSLHSMVGGLPGVRSAIFIPREEGFRRLSKELRSPALLEIPNPLPDAIRVRAAKPGAIPLLASTLAQTRGVKKVVYPSEATRLLLLIRRIVNLISLAASALLLVGALLIIHNTIRLTIFARRREIAIMQMVGASNGFVAAPFLLEGAFYGLSGSFLACALLLPGYGYLVGKAAEALPMLPLAYSGGPLTRFALALVLGGLAIGLSGSAISIHRFLRGEP